jgi:hypothetical protein
LVMAVAPAVLTTGTYMARCMAGGRTRCLCCLSSEFRFSCRILDCEQEIWVAVPEPCLPCCSSSAACSRRLHIWLPASRIFVLPILNAAHCTNLTGSSSEVHLTQDSLCSSISLPAAPEPAAEEPPPMPVHAATAAARQDGISNVLPLSSGLHMHSHRCVVAACMSRSRHLADQVVGCASCKAVVHFVHRHVDQPDLLLQRQRRFDTQSQQQTKQRRSKLQLESMTASVTTSVW